MLNLYKLEIFSIVGEVGSFSGAAERLLMSQSGVSQHIQDLEAALGTQLFERGRRGVTLTAAGKTLFDYTRAIFKLVAEAESAVATIDKLSSGQLTIAATPGLSVYRFPDWLQDFRSRHPKVVVSLQTMVTAQVVATILNPNILNYRQDIGFIEGELNESRPSNLGTLVLEQVSQFVIVGNKHPWATKKQMEIGSLNGCSFVMRQANSQSRIWLEQMLWEQGVHAQVVAEFDNIESIKRTVMASDSYLTILPAYAVQHEQQLNLLSIVALQGDPLQRTVRLVWDKEVVFSPLVRAFLSYLASIFPLVRTLL